MKQLFRKLFLIGCIAWTAVSAGAQVQVEQRLDSVETRIGQQTGLHVRVSLRKGQKAVFPTFRSRQQLVPGVEVLSWKDSDATALDHGMVQLERTYLLTSFHQRLYAIPALKVRVDGHDYQGNPLALKVLTVAVDTLHPNRFYPPKEVQNNPFQWREWSPVFWSGMLLLTLCLFLFYCYVRLKEHKPIITRFRIVKRIPPHEKALSEIRQIKRERVESQEGQKIYYTKLTDALREYIEQRFGFRAMEMTSSDIIDRLRSNGDQEMIDELRELFRTADLVKFAKYETFINENDQNLVNAVKFIDETKTDEVPVVEKVAPTLSDTDKRTRLTRRNIKIGLSVATVLAFVLLVYIVYRVIGLMY